MIFFSQMIPAMLVAVSAYFFIRKTAQTMAMYCFPKGERRTQFDIVARRNRLYPHIHRVLWTWSQWQRGLIPKRTVERYDHRLRSAGSPGGLTGIEFISAAPLCAILLSGIGAFLSSVLSEQSLPGICLGFLSGWILPFARLDSAIVERKRTILTSLPYVIDLISLCMRAGQTFQGALETIIREMNASHPLRFELEFMTAKITLGASTMAALHGLAKRVDIEEINQFVQSAVRAKQKGSSLADIFSIQASIIRTRRSQMAEQAASRAAVAMLGPLMLIFLSVFAVLLGPFGVKAFYGELF